MTQMPSYPEGPYYIVPFKLDKHILDKHDLIFDGTDEMIGITRYYYISRIDYELLKE